MRWTGCATCSHRSCDRSTRITTLCLSTRVTTLCLPPGCSQSGSSFVPLQFLHPVELILLQNALLVDALLHKMHEEVESVALTFLHCINLLDVPLGILSIGQGFTLH